MALLTVITVVKDDATGFGRTMDSLATADLTDVELCVIDSSTDRDPIAARLASMGQASTVYEWRAPEGVYPAMNAGLSAATGNYVYFLNAADVLAGTDTLTRVKDQLARLAPVWAFGRVEFLAEDGSVLPEPSWDYAAERGHWFARSRFPAHQGVFVSRTELMRQGGFDTSYSVAADYASILACAASSTPVELGFTVARFTVGGLSTEKWRLAQSEFHRARRAVFGLSGRDALAEQAYTWRALATTSAYRALWAPDRPGAAWAARLRGGRRSSSG